MKKFLGSLLLAVSLAGFLTPILADTAPPTQTAIQAQSQKQNPALNVGQAQDEDNSLNLDSSEFGMHGPLSFSTVYSQEFGTSVDAKYVQAITDWNAAALEMQYGAGMQRYGVTLAQMLTVNQRIKATVEHLSQKMEFGFAAGNVKQNIGQNAYGLAYQYLMHDAIVKSIDASGYYSKADSHNLSTLVLSNGYLDYRHIAGGVDKNLSGGVTISPWKTSLVSLLGNYDDLYYDTKYESKEHDRGLGFTASLDQLITNQLKVNLLGSMREPSDQYRGGVSYIIPTSARNFWEVGASIERDLGNHGLGDNTQYTLNASFSWDSKATDYSLDDQASLGNIAAFANIPVVHEAQVLAIKDEKIVAPSLDANQASKSAVGAECDPNIIVLPHDDPKFAAWLANNTHYAAGNFSFTSDNNYGNPAGSAFFQFSAGNAAHIDAMTVTAVQVIGPNQFGPNLPLNVNWNDRNKTLTVSGNAPAGTYQLTVVAHDADNNMTSCPQIFNIYFGGSVPQSTGTHAPTTWVDQQPYDTGDLSTSFIYDINQGGPLQFFDTPEYIKVSGPGLPADATLATLGLKLDGSHIVSITNTVPVAAGEYSISVWTKNDIGPSEGPNNGAVIIPLTITKSVTNPPTRNPAAPEFTGPSTWTGDSGYSVSMDQLMTDSHQNAYWLSDSGDVSYDWSNAATVTVTTLSGDTANSLADLRLTADAEGIHSNPGAVPLKIGTYHIDLKATNSIGMSTDTLEITLTTSNPVVQHPPVRDMQNAPTFTGPTGWTIGDDFQITPDQLQKNLAGHAYFINSEAGDTPPYYNWSDPATVTVTTLAGPHASSLADLKLAADDAQGLYSTGTPAEPGQYYIDLKATNQAGISQDVLRITLVISSNPIPAPPIRNLTATDFSSTWQGGNYNVSLIQNSHNEVYWVSNTSTVPYYNMSNPATVKVSTVSGEPASSLQDLNLQIDQSSGALFSTNSLPGKVGTYRIDVKASNDVGMASQILEVTLTTTRPAVTITCPAPKDATVYNISPTELSAWYTTPSGYSFTEIPPYVNIGVAHPVYIFGQNAEYNSELEEVVYDRRNSSDPQLTCSYRIYNSPNQDPSYTLVLHLGDQTGQTSGSNWVNSSTYSYCNTGNSNNTQNGSGKCDLKLEGMN